MNTLGAAAVLVVDDNADLGTVLVKTLGCRHISAHSVISGEDALSWLKHSHPSLVIIDLNMPGISGLDVLQQMKASPVLADIPVILHSAMDTQQVMALADACGASGVLLKGRYAMTDVFRIVEKLGLKPDVAEPS